MKKNLGDKKGKDIKTINIITLSIFFCTLFFITGTVCASSSTPEAVVTNYYNSIKAGNYNNAYTCITKKMSHSFINMSHQFCTEAPYEAGKVEILKFSVSPATIDGDKATVDVLLKSKDIFNPDGLEEKEIDSLVREKGIWKIDSTEILTGEE